MNEMGMRVSYPDTEELLSLHDCDCSHLHWVDGDLCLDMEWMEVLAEHPGNPFDKAHQSGQGRVTLSRAEIQSAVLEKADQSTTPISPAEVDFRDMEILKFHVEPGEGARQLTLFALFNSRSAEYFSLNLQCRYERSQVEWNELHGESWFEAWKDRDSSQASPTP